MPVDWQALSDTANRWWDLYADARVVLTEATTRLLDMRLGISASVSLPQSPNYTLGQLCWERFPWGGWGLCVKVRWSSAEGIEKHYIDFDRNGHHELAPEMVIAAATCLDALVERLMERATKMLDDTRAAIQPGEQLLEDA